MNSEERLRYHLDYANRHDIPMNYVGLEEDVGKILNQNQQLKERIEKAKEYLLVHQINYDLWACDYKLLNILNGEDK